MTSNSIVNTKQFPSIISTKSAFVLILFFVVAGSAVAQVSLGIKAGLNYNDTFFSDSPFSDNTEARLRFHFGAYSRIKISERVSIIPEVQYIGKGYQGDVAGLDYKVNIDYIEVPVMFSYSFLKSFGVDLGPTTGFKILAKSEYDGGSSDLSDRYNKSIEFGLTGGIHLYVADNLKLTAYYYRGFTSISDINVSFGNPAIVHEYNNNFQFSVAYSIVKL